LGETKRCSSYLPHIRNCQLVVLIEVCRVCGICKPSNETG